MENLCSYKFMHCDEIQVNVGNVMEKGVISVANIMYLYQKVISVAI